MICLITGGFEMKKKFNPYDAVMKHGKLTIGTMGAVGIAGKTLQHFPSATGDKVMGSMDTMKVIPMVHGASIGMGALGSLRNVERKARRR